MSEINIAALRKYDEAQDLGNSRRADAIQKIHEGIAEFASLEAALTDAEESIARYTRSDFPSAHFYELVKVQIRLLMEKK